MSRTKLYILIVVFFENDFSSSSEELLPEECGVTRFFKDTTSRIIDGQRARLGQIPWMARLGATDNNGVVSFTCGGSLISRYYVVTAAHCTRRTKDTVRLGENFLNTDPDCDTSSCAPLHQDIKIRNITNHESYNSSDSHVYDYALIELEIPAILNDFVRPICFPSEKLRPEDLASTPLFISGWGLIETDPPIYADYLKYIFAPLLENEKCNTALGTELLDHQLCIGYETGMDSCVGDSGGPVYRTVSHNGINRNYLVGVVSYGLRQCGAGPGVYADVSSFRDWTLQKMNRI